MKPCRRKCWVVWFAIVGTAVAMAFGARILVWEHGLDEEWARARDEVRSGQFDQARARLRKLALARPDDAAVAYELGFCERRLGRPEAAIEAWSRVSPRAGDTAIRAAVASAQVLIELGRYAVAEAALKGLPEPENESRIQPELAIAQELLAFLARFEGRTDEIRPYLERAWELARGRDRQPEWEPVSKPLELLRQYAIVDLEPIAVEEVRATLEEARRKCPDDDRVWLGLANLAIREGRLDEAEQWLRKCESRRLRDAAVGRARLDWAIASSNAEAARGVIETLPNDGLTPERVLTLQAWFALRRGDVAKEREALEDLRRRDPGRLEAIERLAELALATGDPAGARSLREQKARLDEIKRLYKIHYFRPRLPDEAVALAKWAEDLGRRFEARAWWTLLIESRSGDLEARENLIRLQQTAQSSTRPNVADLRAILTRSEDSSTHERVFHFDRGAPARFRDDAEVSGLRFVYDNGASAERQLPETMGGGISLLDFDGDGWLDVYCVQGGSPRDPDRTGTGEDRLFRNRGDGTFEDATARAGLAHHRGFGNGVTMGDYDNDGDPDLFLTRIGSYELFRNRGDGTFEDATEVAGLDGQRDWPTSAAFADIDNDGDLDLYVCHYAAWDVHRPKLCHHADGSRAYCPPHVLEPVPDHLFRNDDGCFVDVTESAGITEEPGRALGVLTADLDEDGRIDIFVANDGTADKLYRNLGGGRFEEVAQESGVAANAIGGYQAGMGVACGDLDGDGKLDLLVTNFYGESTTWFRNLGHGMFADQTTPSGLAALTRHLLGFGIVTLDANNDGQLDLLTVNGHVDDFRPTFPYAMPAQLLLGVGFGRLEDVSAQAGDVFQPLRLGRGLALGDLDRDGQIDAVAINQNEPLVYFHNRTDGGRALRIVLEGTASNRDAIGAIVTVHAQGRRQLATRQGGGSYQSSSEPAIHFGLGRTESIDSVEVAWPSGRKQRFEGLKVDAEYRIRESDSSPVLSHVFHRPFPSP